MHDLYLQVDSLESEKPGPIPWVVGLLALATLFFCLKQDLNRIESDIRTGTLSTLASANAKNVKASIDGRDVSLSGTLSTQIDRNALVANISQIGGVRVVRDDMKEFDPREQAKLDRLKFRQTIEDFDTSKVTFQPNSSALSLSSESTLLRMAQLLKSSPESRIKIAGHTDNSGSAGRNLELSKLRAQSVAEFLMSSGVPAKQLLVQGYGHTRPLYDNNTEAGRTKNRRIEFVFMN